MPNIKCTNCGAVLKTPTAIAPGKKVKCPKCNEPFIVQADEAEKKKPAPEPEEDEGGAFKGLGGGGGDDDDAPPPKKKGKPSKSDDDDEAAEGESDEGEDGSSKKKGKKKNNTTLIIIIVAVLFLCCCGCGGVGTFFRAAIQAAIGIGDAVGKNALDKQFEEALKKAEEDAKKQQKK